MESYLQLGLQPLRPLTWKQTFEFWRESEGSNPEWLAVARERGYETWEAWRNAYVAPFKLDQRSWGLYRVVNPVLTVPRFRGGPFQGWVERFYHGQHRPTPTFGRIAEELFQQGNGRATSLKSSFPRQTTVIGVMTSAGVVIVEGMHRCSAIASTAADGTPIQTELSIALGSALPGDLDVIPKIYNQAPRD